MDEQKKIEVYDREGKVVFHSLEGDYVFEPGVAVEYGLSILRAAKECGVEVKIDASSDSVRRSISSAYRLALITRAVRIMDDMVKHKRNSTFICTHIVDTILAALS